MFCFSPFLSSKLHIPRPQSSLLTLLWSLTIKVLFLQRFCQKVSHPEQDPFHWKAGLPGRWREEGMVRTVYFPSPGPLIWSTLGFPGWWHQGGRCWKPVLCAGVANTLLGRSSSHPTDGREAVNGDITKRQACEGWSCTDSCLLYCWEGPGDKLPCWQETRRMCEKVLPKQLTESTEKFWFLLLEKEEGTEEIELSGKSDN